MTISVSHPAINLREKLSELAARPQYSQYQFWFLGDGTTTDFALPRGWKPLHVFVHGELHKEGAAEEYTVLYDGFIYTVSFNVAPHGNNNDIAIIAERT